jgi:hypothetical protein
MRLRVAPVIGPGWRVCPAGLYGPHRGRIEVLYVHLRGDAPGTWQSPGVLPRISRREAMAVIGEGEDASLA